MERSQELNRIIRNLCMEALNGKLKLEDFHRLWPEEASNNPFYGQVYEDLEDGVEHTPGFFLKPGVDVQSWRNSDLYLTIFLDSILLGMDKSTDELLECRSFVVRQESLSEEMIKNAVREYFKQ